MNNEHAIFWCISLRLAVALPALMRERGPPRQMSEYAVGHPMRGDLYRPVPVCFPDRLHRLLPGRLIHPVDEKHAVEVVGLVLQAPGEYVGADHLNRVAAVGKAPGHRVQPALDVVVDAGEGQAALLAFLVLLVGEVEDRVYQVAALAVDRVGEYPQPDADLGRGQPSPLRVVKGLGQVLDQRAELLVEGGEGGGGGAQDRVAEESDGTDRHDSEGIRRCPARTPSSNLFDRFE